MLASVLLSAYLFGAGALPAAQSQKDEFIYNNKGEVETIDPARIEGVPDNNIGVQLFEGLMARKQDWVTLTPGLAESYTVSKDQTLYTFKMRKNAKWSDGSPITAKDVEWSWFRVLDPKTLASYASWLSDNIEGADEYHKNPTAENAKKVKISAVDDSTLVVKLNKPIPYFLQLCAESVTYPVKREVVEKYKEQWTRPENIVTSGAYKLTFWKVQDRMILEKNPNYYGAASVKLNKIIALPLEDRQTALNMFLQGKLDWSGQQGVPNSQVPSFKGQPNFRMFPGFITYYYWINTSKKPLDDIRVRQALALAIDRKSITEKVTRGGEMSAANLVPGGIGTYQSAKGYVTADHQANLKKAKELLAAAGFPDGKGFPTLNLQYNTDENHKKVAQAIADMWKKELGITVRPYNQEWKVYLAAQRNMEFDISRAGWSGDYPDAGTFLELGTSTSGNNHSLWKGAKADEYDKLFQEANRTMNAKKRDQILAKAEQILVEETPLIPIFFYTNFGFMRPEVQGYAGNLIDRPYFRYMSKIDTSKLTGGVEATKKAE